MVVLGCFYGAARTRRLWARTGCYTMRGGATREGLAQLVRSRMEAEVGPRRWVIDRIRVYVGGLLWRVASRWPGRNRTSQRTPWLVLARGGRDVRRWKFSAALGGPGVSTRVTHARRGSDVTWGSFPAPLTVQVSGEVVGGAVAQDVADIEVELVGGGSFHLPLLGHGLPARFYAAEVPGPLLPAAVAAYDHQGMLLERIELRHEPPGTAGDRAPLPDPPGPRPLDRRLDIPKAHDHKLPGSL